MSVPDPKFSKGLKLDPHFMIGSDPHFSIRTNPYLQGSRRIFPQFFKSYFIKVSDTDLQLFTGLDPHFTIWTDPYFFHRSDPDLYFIKGSDPYPHS